MLGSRKISPDELSEGFARLGLVGGECIMLHALLESMGMVDGGAAMVLHRLTRTIGSEGTLLMPTFTSVARHAIFHSNFTRKGCWCEGMESRYIPFIPELQPDKEIGAIAHRLCSWPSSRRSNHPAYSYVAVGNRGDELVREVKLDDPLLPVRKFLKRNPRLVTIGVGFLAVTAIHLAVETVKPAKFVKERALSMSSKGPVWVEIRSTGCSNGFGKLFSMLGSAADFRQISIGMVRAESYSMKYLVDSAQSLLKEDSNGLDCGNASCLSCHPSANSTSRNL
jgi:aminoglycoside 3-N-acetyltransferase